MNRLVSFIVLFAVILSVAGCDDLKPIGQVLATRTVDSLIQQIGETEIQRQKVVNAINEAKDEITRLQRVEAENRVKADMLSEKLETLRNNREEMRQSLLHLADLIEAGRPITLTNGTVLTVSDLTNYAERSKSQFELLNQKIAIYEASIESLRATAQEAHRRWMAGKNIVAELEARLELLDAQIAALKLFQDRPEISRSTSSYQDSISAAQKIMEETSSKIEESRRVFEEMRELQIAEDQQIQSQFDLLELDLRSSEDIVSELRSLADQ